LLTDHTLLFRVNGSRVRMPVREKTHDVAVSTSGDCMATLITHRVVSRSSDAGRVASLVDRGYHAVRSIGLDEDVPGAGPEIGTSPGWRGVVKRARQVAMTDTTTCLHGESGTGKEVVARLIHRISPRHRGPFMAINCAALPEQLLESELFGFERGAFTGADHVKVGQIELAD